MTASTESISTFLSPPKVMSGRASSLEIGRITAGGSASVSRVLLAVDPALVELGLADGVQKALADADIGFSLVSAFGPELTVEQVDSAVRIARDEGCEAVVGVGGGSVLDAAKVIAVLIENRDMAPDDLDAVGSANSRSPLSLLPTTCGTGSEVTRVSMVSVGNHKRIVVGDVLIPDIAILDPSFLDSLPSGVVGSTGMDALAHAVESVMSTTRSAMTQLVAFEAMTIITAHLRSAHEGDRHSREQMQWASHLAGLALNAGVVIGHSLAYSAARLKPMPHGTSCALALPYAIAYNRRLPDALAKRLASTITAGASTDLYDAAEAVVQLARDVGQPTNLDEAGVPPDSEAEIARICVTDYPRPTNPEGITAESVERLVMTMRDGDLSGSFAVMGNVGSDA